MKRRYRLGIFIGRFQPFHKGHLSALRRALRLCDRVVVGIGGANRQGTDSNPLSTKDRITIISSALRLEGIDARRVRFIGIPDFECNDTWFDYIISREPGIEVVLSRNRLVKSIFRGKGISAISPKWKDRGRLDASIIRDRMRKGLRWDDRVPKGAVKEIKNRRRKIIEASDIVNRTHVIVGGTFAYLHRGHRALLKMAFRSGDFVHIGLTTDGYVKRMKLHGHMPPYRTRKNLLTGFVKRYGKEFAVVPLNDSFGPSTSGDFDVIVVSPETYRTAVEINRIRRLKGLRPLRIMRIRYALADDRMPISTTRILNGEIDNEGRLVRKKHNRSSGKK
ncbi:pantetheine-phosphate adenylyltransferase [Candidatus Marsarchaeota archaeon]|nr:pantetheine-phosphate adenylyltransferase [Candidatus Marsarchaeota archaeon]